MLRNKERRRCWENTSYVIHTDIRKQLDRITSSQESIESYNTSLAFVFPWWVDGELSSSVKKLIGGNVSTLATYDSFQGIGTSFTVYFGNSFGVSNFLTSYKAMSIMDYFITFCTKDTTPAVSEIMYKCV